MNNLIFSINVVAPVFIIILLGIFLKRIKIIDDGFVSKASSVVYKTALPVLIFNNIRRTDFVLLFNGKVVLVFYTGIFCAFLLSGFLSFFIKTRKGRGAFIQGAFWGNSVIVGLALVLNVFGASGVAAASILIAFIVPVFNILAVLVLTVNSEHGRAGSVKLILYKLSRNPLIIAVAVSVPFSVFKISLPGFLSSSLSYLAQMALPLALIGIGGSLSFSSLRANILLSITASCIKIVVTPLVVVLLALKFEIHGQLLGILFLISATPTAISSFIMARAMDGDSRIAANIIVITTLGSILTMGAGIYILKAQGLLGI